MLYSSQTIKPMSSKMALSILVYKFMYREFIQKSSLYILSRVSLFDIYVFSTHSPLAADLK